MYQWCRWRSLSWTWPTSGLWYMSWVMLLASGMNTHAQIETSSWTFTTRTFNRVSVQKFLHAQLITSVVSLHFRSGLQLWEAKGGWGEFAWPGKRRLLKFERRVCKRGCHCMNYSPTTMLPLCIMPETHSRGPCLWTRYCPNPIRFHRRDLKLVKE